MTVKYRFKSINFKAINIELNPKVYPGWHLPLVSGFPRTLLYILGIHYKERTV